ncbi:hypothetical protein [Streptomyces violaceusniger]|uniref:hypothetical protein n=1 Tax=Streptomyces violaceusniger TaxID=68280 RepID=UPI003F578E37
MNIKLGVLAECLAELSGNAMRCGSQAAPADECASQGFDALSRARLVHIGQYYLARRHHRRGEREAYRGPGSRAHRPVEAGTYGAVEDVARLSPLEHENVNLLGRYGFTASMPAAGVLRPPRDPDAPEPDEDDDGAHWPGWTAAQPAPGSARRTGGSIR